MFPTFYGPQLTFCLPEFKVMVTQLKGNLENTFVMEGLCLAHTKKNAYSNEFECLICARHCVKGNFLLNLHNNPVGAVVVLMSQKRKLRPSKIKCFCVHTAVK